MPIRNETLDRLVDELSPEARELWEATEKLSEDTPVEEKRAPEYRRKLEELARRSLLLSAQDQEIFVAACVPGEEDDEDDD